MVLAMTTLGAPVKVGSLYYEITGPSTVKVMPDRSQSPTTNQYAGNVAVPSTVTIDGKTYTVNELGKNAFSSCFKLTGVTLPNTIERIDSGCFNASSSLKNLVLPSSLRVIEANGISSCGLTSITINEGLDSIGYGGIGYLNYLTDTLRLPASLRAMAPGAVGFSHKLTAITVAPGNANFKSEDGIVYSKDGKTLWAVPCYKDFPNGFTLPSSVNRIESYAASNLDRLYKLSFSYTTIDLADHALEGCTKLQTIEKATSIRTIGVSAMDDLLRLHELKLGYNLLRIDSAGLASAGYSLPGNTDGMPSRCVIDLTQCRGLRYIGANVILNSSVEEIYIPLNCDTIAQGAFNNATYLKMINVTSDNKNYVSINGCLYDKALTTLIKVPNAYENQMFQFPKGVRHIAPYAFAGCRNMREVPLPDDLLSLGENSFYTSGLVRVEFPASLKKLPINCFAYTALQHVVVPPTITEMEGGVFSNCSQLVSAQLPDDLEYVAPGTFYGDGQLTQVNIPSKAKTIGYNSFNNCYMLTKVVIPDAVKKIEYNAFGCNFNPYNHGTLDTLILGSGLDSIESSAFTGQSYIVYIKTFNPVPPVVDENGAWVKAVHSKALVDVIEGSLQAYKNAPIWNLFEHWSEFAGVNGVEEDGMKYKVVAGAIEFNGEGHVEVYNISGLRIYSGPATRVEVPARGVYIIRCAGKTAKVSL